MAPVLGFIGAIITYADAPALGGAITGIGGIGALGGFAAGWSFAGFFGGSAVGSFEVDGVERVDIGDAD